MQFEFAGALDVPDGRYLARTGGRDEVQAVLVLDTLGAPSPPSRRRRQPREARPEEDRPFLPLARVTAVRACEPFDSVDDAARWLERAVEAEDVADALVAEGIDLLNRALHVHAVASANPRGQELSPQRAVLVRIGYGSGEELAAGRFSVAYDIDVTASGFSRKRREDELHHQERLAAVLGERERLDVCETLLLRAQADLDAGRAREAALQLRVALEALLAELVGALVDPAHHQDMATLDSRRDEATTAAEAALHGDLDEDLQRSVRELTEICERILRRRRVLRG